MNHAERLRSEPGFAEPVIAWAEAGRLGGVVLAGEQALRERLVDQYARAVLGSEGKDIAVAGRRGRGERV